MDIIHRLNALASNEHDDLTIGFEAAATIIDLRLETKEQAREIERLRMIVGCECIECQDDEERVAAEYAALKMDAERYREIMADVHTCGPTCRKTPACAERADLREAIRVCLVYWLGGDSPDDCPHTVAKIKALCDWDSQLDDARSAP